MEGGLTARTHHPEKLASGTLPNSTLLPSDGGSLGQGNLFPFVSGGGLIATVCVKDTRNTFSVGRAAKRCLSSPEAGAMFYSAAGIQKKKITNRIFRYIASVI